MVVHLALYLVSSQAEDIKVLGDKRKIRFFAESDTGKRSF